MTPGAHSKIAGVRIGYARVSTADQNPQLQIDALEGAGCSRIFTEHASGGLKTRPELDRALDQLRAGDSLVIWKLDRLGRSLINLVAMVGEIEERGANLVSLTEALDTASSSGRLIFHVFGALAEFERDVIRERTAAGLAAARERGRVGGRPSALSPADVDLAVSMSAARLDDGAKRFTADEIARAVGASRSTVYRAIARRRELDPERVH